MQGGQKFEGVLIYDDAVKSPRPGLVLVPNWLGIDEANLKQAQQIAGTQYVVLVADMYGKDARPKSMPEASKAAGAVKGDRKLMRARANKALEVLLASGKDAGLDPKKVGAIGFCFGGTTVIELAKSGANVGGVVSFHGGLDAVEPASGKILARGHDFAPSRWNTDVRRVLGGMGPLLAQSGLRGRPPPVRRESTSVARLP